MIVEKALPFGSNRAARRFFGTPKEILKTKGPLRGPFVFRISGGGIRIRTEDLLHAMQALYQLSYTPNAADLRVGSGVVKGDERCGGRAGRFFLPAVGCPA